MALTLLKIVESDERKSGRKVPPKNVNRRTRVLGRANNVHHWGVKGKGGGDVDLNNNQRVVMDFRTPLKIMKCTNEERGSSKACV